MSTFSKGSGRVIFNENTKNFLEMASGKLDKKLMGIENVTNVLYNYSAALDPSETDDTTKGYSVGSIWLNNVSRRSFICTHSNVGVATWKEITENSTIDDVSTNETNKVWSSQKLTTELNTKSNLEHNHDAIDISDFNTTTDVRINLQKGLANGIVTTDGNNKIATEHIPPIAITDVNSVVDIVARDALVVQEGDFAMVADNGFGDSAAYIYDGTNWILWWNQSSVTTVNGLGPGVVILSTTDISEGTNLYYTEDRVNNNTTVSSNTTHVNRTDNPHTVTTTQLGLGNISNIKDKNDGIVPPTINNDNNENYSARSIWVDAINDKVYICINASTGAANWMEITADDTIVNNHIADIGNPHSVTKTQLGLGDVTNLKNKLDGSGPPNIAQDDSQGYSVGSRWIDVSNLKTYTCVDVTTGAANWLETTSTYDHSSYDTHIGDNTIHAVINDGATTSNELWSGSYMNTQMQSKINYSETTLINVANGTSGSINHIGLQLTKAHSGVDDYNIDVDSSIVKAILSQEGGTLRSALVLSDVASSDKTAFGLSTSVNSGTTWNPQMVIRHNGNMGIGNNDPQSKLDVTGEIRAASLKVSGIDITGFKLKLDAIIPPTINNDITEGYVINSTWIDTIADKCYICLDNTDGVAVWKDITQDSTGADNTASNVGTGIDIFKQKTGIDLEFRGINASSNKLSAVLNADNIDVDVVSGNILIGDLSGAPIGTVIGTSDIQTLTNKTIDAINNTISNITNANIKIGANIDITKLGTGDILAVEFGYLNGVTSGIQDQINFHNSDTNTHGVSGTIVGTSDTQTLTNKTFTDSSTFFQDETDNTKKLQFQLNNITSLTTRTLTILDANTIIVGHDTTQTLTNKTIDSDLNTLTNIVNANIKNGANIDTSKLGTGVISTTEFNYLNGVTSSIQTQISGKSNTSHTHTAIDITDFDVEVGNHSDVISNTTHRTSDGSDHTFINQNVTTAGIPTFAGLNVDNLYLDSNTLSSTNVDGDINLTPNGNGSVVLKADPITNLGAATKQYVDSVATGHIDYKDPARIVVTTPLQAYTRIGLILQANATGLIPNIDGIMLEVNDRLLVTTGATTSDAHNGVYEVTQLGSGVTTWILTRTSDATDDADVTSGLYIYIREGIVGGKSAWILTTPNPIVVNTTALTFVEFSSVQQLSGNNIGTSGVSVFKQKNGNVMEYRTINTSSSKVSVILDDGNNEVDLDIVPSNINIGDLNNAPIGTVIGSTDSQTLTNKTYDADLNILTNIDDGNIKVSANIDVSKFGTGIISNTEFNYLNGVTSGLQTQIDGKSNTSHTHIIRQGHSWGISGEIKVPSGDVDFLIPFFVSLAGGQTANIVSARYKINTGTSVTAKIQKNDVDVTGFTNISVTTASTTTNPTNISLSDNDKLALVVTGVVGSPKNLSFTLFLEHTI